MSVVATFAEPTAAAGGVRAWVRETLVLTGRQLLTLVRDKATAVQLILVPIAIMLMFTVVLGDAVKWNAEELEAEIRSGRTRWTT